MAETLSALALHFSQSKKVHKIFGVAGDPITPFISFAESYGIQFFGFRNEQAASYAASAVSFLSCRNSVGICLTVAGPGFTNAITGLANACTNEWPVILVCPLVIKPGDFQSIDQLAIVSSTPTMCRGYVIYDKLKSSVDLAIKMSLDHNGGVVLFVPSDRIQSSSHFVYSVSSSIPRSLSNLSPLSSPSCRPLVVIGSRAPMYPELCAAIRSFIETNRIVFFADPMGRGVVPESHPLCVSAARSRAISTATVAIIIGGNLDWMLHHGNPPKWAPNCQFITVSSPDDRKLLQALHVVESDDLWRSQLVEFSKSKRSSLPARLSPVPSSTLPNHWQAIGAVKRLIGTFSLEDSIIVSEGANTMDVCRVALDEIAHPRRRLDSGRWGTMGAGLGFVLAACSHDSPEKIVIAVEGDSAFGFSGMELETLVRYKCKCIIVVFNNSGIYTGSRDNATAFGQVCHANLMEAFGGFGVSSRGIGPDQALTKAMHLVKSNHFPVLVDLIIDPTSGTASGSLSRM